MLFSKRVSSSLYSPSSINLYLQYLSHILLFLSSVCCIRPDVCQGPQTLKLWMYEADHRAIYHLPCTNISQYNFTATINKRLQPAQSQPVLEGEVCCGIRVLFSPSVLIFLFPSHKAAVSTFITSVNMFALRGLLPLSEHVWASRGPSFRAYGLKPEFSNPC